VVIGTAHASRLDAVQMGTDIGQGGPLIAALVGIAIQAIGRSEHWANIEKLNAPQCRAAIARLDDIYARRLKAADALQEEKYVGQDWMLKIMREPNWRILSAGSAATGQENITLSTRWRALTASKRAIVDNYTRHLMLKSRTRDNLTTRPRNLCRRSPTPSVVPWQESSTEPPPTSAQ
jgi:hypothetical protein